MQTQENQYIELRNGDKLKVENGKKKYVLTKDGETISFKEKIYREVEKEFEENNGILPFGLPYDVKERDYEDNCKIEALMNKADIIVNLSKNGLYDVDISEELRMYILNRFNKNSTVFMNFNYIPEQFHKENDER